MRKYPVRIAGVHFGREEWEGLMLASLALCVAYTFPTLLKLPTGILMAFIVFLPHEVAHKILAFSYGFTAKFRASITGMLTLLLTSFATLGSFTTGYAGYVEIESKLIEDYQIANIALAGPLTNILTGLFLRCLGDIIMPGIFLLKEAGLVCIWIALFNLLPKSPLDGKWVFSYSKRLWFISFMLGLASAAVVIFL